MSGQLGAAGSGQVCAGNCCGEVGCMRAQLVPGHCQMCSAQCFSCAAVPGVNLARPRWCSASPVILCWHKQERCDSPVSCALHCHLGNPSVTGVKEQ